MSIVSFEKLLSMIAPKLKINATYSKNRTGIDPVTPENQLQLTLSWLGGGRYHDIRALAGTSKTYFFAVVNRVIDAICSTDALRLKFPTTGAEIYTARKGFQNISSNGILTGCVGAIDGWLCQIKVPTTKECGRVRSFFSGKLIQFFLGHYQCYGINVQACCDYDSRFTALGVNSPGGRNDAVAYLEWDLKNRIDALPDTVYVAGSFGY
jgi:hypothetical protein